MKKVEVWLFYMWLITKYMCYGLGQKSRKSRGLKIIVFEEFKVLKLKKELLKMCGRFGQLKISPCVEMTNLSTGVSGVLLSKMFFELLRSSK